MRLNPDNGFFRFLSLVSDLLMLNVLFIITCLPIVTIGPALTALYSVSLDMIRKRYPTISSSYFKAFKKHFKQSILLWIPISLLYMFFITDLYVIYKVIDPVYNMFQIPVWILLFLLLSISMYAFPLISAYPNKTKVIIKNSLLISLANVPTTIFYIVIPLAIAKVAVTDSTTLVFVFSLFLFWGFATIAYVYAFFMNRIFIKIEDAERERANLPTRHFPVDMPYDERYLYTDDEENIEDKASAEDKDVIDDKDAIDNKKAADDKNSADSKIDSKTDSKTDSSCE